ncbi:hypothetical protein FHW88_002770 [Mucilaginibacter sp. SG538B]|uniref:hypothetical protein n=1 Tax=Mucilaginibacter sp. SG538B TaxID=2587021 RepID=UPI00159D677C|nr:hypothetical protein [Mucilaginibacter sp. SG538B]NVM64481.1 hypothetical protein [Mucilaginibacter sp. SG538B]
MNEVILTGICAILNDNKSLLRLAMQQKAKFEGWLKFELAHYLTQNQYENIQLERSDDGQPGRPDIAFETYAGERFRIELKTSNTNWSIAGVRAATKPITKNIRSIISDSRKTGSTPLIVGFVLFPIGLEDQRWLVHLNVIIAETGVQLTEETHYRFVEMEIDRINKCRALVCTFTAVPSPQSPL